MNTGIKDGKLVIDMAEADALWDSMNKDQQYDMMCVMFDPIMERATEMHRALVSIKEASENNKDLDTIHAIAVKHINP